MKSIALGRSAAGLVVTIALAAALFAVATPAKAAGLAGGSPWGSVDTFNGVPQQVGTRNEERTGHEVTHP